MEQSWSFEKINNKYLVRIRRGRKGTGGQGERGGGREVREGGG
jgi:hypothetical protein